MDDGFHKYAMPSIRDLLNTIKLFETPLASYEVHGDFEQEGSHRAKDRKLLASPRAAVRLTKLLSPGCFDIALHVVNLSKDQLNASSISNPKRMNDYRDTADQEFSNFPLLGGEANTIAGEYSQKELFDHFGLRIKANPEAINFVVAGNAAGDHALSAWMIIHRLTHMVEDAVKSGSGRASEDISEAWNSLEQITKHRITYMIKNEHGVTLTRIKQYRDFATMKSAGQPGQEVCNEFLVQYLALGRTPLRRDLVDGPSEAALHSYEIQMSNACHDVGEAMVGKIFFSF